MKFFDSRVTVDALSYTDLEAMAAAGIKALLSDAAGGMDIVTSANTATVNFDRHLVGEASRAGLFMIEVYVAVGIKMFAIPPDYAEILEAMPAYLKKERVVAVGEIGLDPRSRTCPDIEKQKEVLLAQLKMAQEFNKPAVLHLPPIDSELYLDTYFKMIDAVKLPHDMVVISHLNAATLKPVLDFGAYGDLSVLPMRRMTPEDAAGILVKNDCSRILVASDSYIRHRNDPLSVPRVAIHLVKNGWSESQIEKLLWENPRRFYGIS